MKKVAFVTASTSGIGCAIVKKLLKNGYIVYANGRDIEKFEKLKQQLQNKNLKKIICDTTCESSIKNALKIIEKEEKRIDLVVANLGKGSYTPGVHVNTEEFKNAFDYNFFSSVSLALESIPYLKKYKGNMIFISSIAGCEYLGAPISYTSAKTALLSFSKSLSMQLADYGIRVNSISPGNVMFKGSTWDRKIKADKEKVENYINDNVALKKFIKPKDIAKAVVFLEKNNSITGQNIIVDAGQINKII